MQHANSGYCRNSTMCSLVYCQQPPLLHNIRPQFPTPRSPGHFLSITVIFAGLLVVIIVVHNLPFFLLQRKILILGDLNTCKKGLPQMTAPLEVMVSLPKGGDSGLVILLILADPRFYDDILHLALKICWDIFPWTL